MKKTLIITLIALAILIILLVVFIVFKKNKSNENICNVRMTIEEGSLTRTSATIILEGEDEFFCGPSYSIEKRTILWKELNEIDGYIWGMMMYGCGNNRKISFNLDWSKLYGELENGKYRISKYVNTPKGSTTVYAEFTIE